jgi:hypothetical protein
MDAAKERARAGRVPAVTKFDNSYAATAGQVVQRPKISANDGETTGLNDGSQPNGAFFGTSFTGAAAAGDPGRPLSADCECGWLAMCIGS